MFKIRFLKLFSCLFLMSGIVCSVASAEFDIEYKLLSELGVIGEKIEIDDENITRAEFAVMVANMRGFSGETIGASNFVDVEEEYFAKGEIGYLVTCGIMRGMSYDRFNPGLTIKTEDAYRVIFNALGYTDYISEKYDTLASAAAVLGLDRGLSKNTELSKKDAVKLLYNTLDVDILEITYSGGGYSVNFESGKTPLTEWLELEYTEGIVTKVSDALLTNDFNSGEFVIGNTSLGMSEQDDFYEYLGYFCRGYFDIETQELKAVEIIDSKNHIEEYDTKYVSFKDGNLTYSVNGKSKRIPIDAKDDVVLNGVPVGAKDREAAINNADGKITINEISGYDGKIVMITSYETYCVGGVSSENNTVYDKAVPGRTLVLDTDNKKIFTDRSFDKLKTGDILTVLKHGDKGDMTVKVSEAKISGTVTEQLSDEGIISLQDVDYEFTKDYRRVNSNLPAPGALVTLYLDAFGRVAYVSEGSTDAYTYGFLYKTIVSADDDSLRFKIYNQKGEFITVKTQEKLRIDGGVYSSIMEKKTALGADNANNESYRLIRYKQNSKGEISEVDTTAIGGSETDTNSLKKVHSLNSEGSLYKMVPKAFGGTGQIGLQVVTDSSTVIMTVPTKDTQDESVFKIGKTFENDKKYSFEAYKSNLRDIPADILVFYEETATVDQYGYGFVSDIKVVYDDNTSEVLNALTVVTSTQGEKVFYADSDFDIKNSTVVDGDEKRVPEKGDIVIMSLNSQSKIMNIKIVYDASEKEWLAGTSPYGSIYNDHLYHGTIYRKDSGYLQISKGVTTDGVTENNLCPIPCASNVRYLKYNRETKETENITPAAILDFDSVGNGASEAVIITRAASGVIVVIYE